MSGSDYLRGNVYEFATNRCGIACDRDHLFQDILFEGFKEQEGDQHAIVKCRVGGKTFEGQLLKTKIFETTMGQFISSPTMVAFNNGLGFEPVLTLGLCAMGQDR